MEYKIDAKQVKRAAAGRWFELLPLIDSRLTGACSANGLHVPCPAGTGTKDGFRIPLNAALDGHAFHNQLENTALSDGFKLLMWLNGWSFYEALQAVDAALNGNAPELERRAPKIAIKKTDYSKRRKVFDTWLHESSETPHDAALLYYARRGLLDAAALRSGALRYIDAIPYMHDGRYITRSDGKWLTTPAILCGMRTEKTVAGFCVIRLDQQGNKASNLIQREIERERGIKGAIVNPKQLLTIIPDIKGAAFRLGPVGAEWSVGEGVETMLAVASALKTESVAAATTAAMLENLEVPEHVKTLRIFADKDRNGRGLVAAERLRDRVSNRCTVVIHTPESEIPSGARGIDWLDDQYALKTTGV